MSELVEHGVCHGMAGECEVQQPQTSFAGPSDKTGMAVTTVQESLVFRPLVVSRMVKISCQVSMDRECRRGASDHDYKQPQSHSHCLCRMLL